MLWVKTFHIFFMITWMCGIFYLPRLFVYHASLDTNDVSGHERFVTMENKLFKIIMTPGAILTIIFGTWLWLGYGFSGTWLHAKLACVIGLVVYHFFCYRHLVAFRSRQNTKSHKYFRVFNEVPSLLLLLILIFVVVKPF